MVRLNRQDLLRTRVGPADDDQGFKVQVRRGRKKTWYEGDEAHRFAGAILPRVNALGGKRETVQQAVHRIETAGHPERFLAKTARLDSYLDQGVPGHISKMPKPTQLALEMALHEEQERRALEGKLWLLERAWEEAEEVAEISDNLLLPAGTEEFLREHGEGPVHGSRGPAGKSHRPR